MPPIVMESEIDRFAASLFIVLDGIDP